MGYCKWRDISGRCSLRPTSSSQVYGPWQCHEETCEVPYHMRGQAISIVFPQPQEAIDEDEAIPVKQQV